MLLEGSPGVGKTSLIVALGKYSGHNVVRINLSEQVGVSESPSFSFLLLCSLLYSLHSNFNCAFGAD